MRVRVQVAVAPGAEQNCIRFYPNGRTDGMRILLQGPGPEHAPDLGPGNLGLELLDLTLNN